MALLAPGNKITTSMKKKLFLLISLFACVTFFIIKGSAESATSDKSPEEQIEQFFKIYKDDTQRAVLQLMKTNKNVNIENSDLIPKLKDTISKIGHYNGNDFIIKRKAGNSMVLYSYLAKHDVQPLRITFIFYKPKEDWIVYDFSFDTEVDEELKRAADLYFIEETYTGSTKK